MGEERRKVLFISAPVGAGHVRAAQAVGAALRRLAPGVATEFANVFDFFSPRLGKAILAGYLKVLDVFPQAYGAAYGWGNSSRLALAGRAAVSGFLAGRMERYIAVSRPDVVVVSHATPAGLVAHLAARGRLAAPTVAVVTDFVVHRLWVYPELGMYCVAHEGLRDYLAAAGVPRERSAVTGIPVDGRFAAPLGKREARAALGLREDAPVVLIMGGGAGVLPMAEIVAGLEALARPLQLVAVAGRNEALRRRLTAEAGRLKFCTLEALGFVDNVDVLMAAADLLVSKPGGLTAAEALARGLPLLIFRPIPGQEDANTAFLTAHGAAVRVESAGELAALAGGMLAERAAGLEALSSAALDLGRPGAAEAVGRLILDRLVK
ncbi:MGDG synthase family glycosyltransferase [Anaeroselena agilis]|uniref:Glycosyltransferase n=1 Tax=Anaeroselena agilis TaxID=3063788 RepID=A0ABU3NYD1_9FIRM|nr:glycosyltransferase [Selenomonadales bacterium 4137-cl]